MSELGHIALTLIALLLMAKEGRAILGLLAFIALTIGGMILWSSNPAQTSFVIIAAVLPAVLIPAIVKDRAKCGQAKVAAHFCRMHEETPVWLELEQIMREHGAVRWNASRAHLGASGFAATEPDTDD